VDIPPSAVDVLGKPLSAVASATPPLRLEVASQGKTFKFLATPDTGASATIVSHELMEEQGLRLFPCSAPLTQADGSALPVDGCVYATVTYMDMTIQIGCFVFFF